MLSKEDILKAEDRKIEIVDVPEWGGQVGIRVMSGAERDRWELDFITKPGNREVRASLLAFTLCDENGKPLFTEADVKALGEKSGAVLTRLFVVAKRLSAVGAEDVEELEKN